MTILRNTKPEMERRYKIMHLPETAMLDTLLINATLPGDCVCKLSFEGVEEGTQVVDRFYDPQYQSEAILLYNPLWPKIGDGEVATIIPARVKTVVVDLRIPREPKDCLQPLSKQIGVFTQAGRTFQKFRESLERLSRTFQKLQEEGDQADEDGFPIYGTELEKWLLAHGTPIERGYIKYRHERMIHHQGLQAIYVLTLQGWRDAKCPSPFNPLHDNHPKFAHVVMHPPDIVGVFEATINGEVIGRATNKIVSDGVNQILDMKIDPDAKPVILYPKSDIQLCQGPPVYGGVLESLNITVADLHAARRILGQDTITDEEAQRRIDAGLPEDVLKAWGSIQDDLIARMTETPSFDSLLDQFRSTEDIRPKGDPIRVRVIDRTAGEPVQESKEGDTWRDRKPLL